MKIRASRACMWKNDRPGQLVSQYQRYPVSWFGISVCIPLIPRIGERNWMDPFHVRIAQAVNLLIAISTLFVQTSRVKCSNLDACYVAEMSHSHKSTISAACAECPWTSVQIEENLFWILDSTINLFLGSTMLFLIRGFLLGDIVCYCCSTGNIYDAFRTPETASIRAKSI
jgi:hypothetical protein